MGYRTEDFAPGNIYHVYSRGVNKRKIFSNDQDRRRLRSLLHHCLPQKQIQSYSIATRLNQIGSKTVAGRGLVDILAYCFMPNHIHLLLQENTERGVSHYMQRLLNSYARYFNKRHQRTGPLFTGRFGAVGIDDDEQFLHVSRYIHLNPYVAHLIDTPLTYEWFSLREYIDDTSTDDYCHTRLLKEILPAQDYHSFVVDEADYAQTIADIKHLLLE